MNLTELINEARKQYRLSGETVYLPERQHVSTPGYARLSAMDNCPLKHAYDKAATVPDFEGLMPNNNSGISWIMDHGTKVAEMVQIPLLWYGTQADGYSIEVEEEVRDNDLKIIGRMDMKIKYASSDRGYGWDEELIVEIKNAEGKTYRSIGEPRLSYCLQTLGYMMLTGVTHGAICIVSKWGFHVYYLNPVSDGRYVLVDESGYRYRPAYGTQWNDPDVLNFESVKAEVQTLHDYMLQVGEDGVVPPPIKDPLNNPDKGWLCGKHVKKTHVGELYVSCPYAEKCHGWTRVEQKTQKVGNRWELVPLEF